MVSTVLPLYLVFTLRLSPFQFGMIDGLYQGAAAFFRLLGGVLADRWRRPKEVATMGYAFSALCRVGILFAGGNWMALSGMILLDRVGKGIRTPARDAMIAASSAPERLATAFGVHRAMDTAGAMLGPLLASALLALTAGAYDAVFIVSFCIALVGVAVIGLFVQNPAEPAAEKPGVAFSWRTIGGLWELVDFRQLVILATLLALTTLSDTFLYLTLQRRTNLSTSLFPLLYVATALIFMLLAVFVGHLADRIGRRRVFVAGYGLLALGYGCLLLPAPTWLMASGLLLSLGLYYAATDGVMMALASALLPAHLRSTGLALLTTGTGLARLLSSSLYGALWSWRSAEDALAIFLAGLIVAIMIALYALRHLKE
jgi:MFS family permease